ncbi:MAG: SGNH/GDSL hydrolase family protein [Marmoricola sp.]
MSFVSLPRPRGRTWSLSAALLLLALALSACGTQANPHPKSIDTYVAMGDSYTALAGAGPFSDEACKRTLTDYPELVAKALAVKNFTNASCGGATSADLAQEQLIQNPPASRPPQLAKLSKKTKLVTLGIGLNNGSSPMSYLLLYVCLPVNGITLPQCSQYLKIPESGVVEAVRTMAGEVKGNLKAIRKAAPNARIVLVGYPRVLADDRDCATALPLPPAAATRLREALKLVNQYLAKTARTAKVDYIDMYQASKGHELCSNEPWVAGEANVPGKALQFHPYDAYHRAVADKIVALLKK